MTKLFVVLFARHLVLLQNTLLYVWCFSGLCLSMYGGSKAVAGWLVAYTCCSRTMHYMEAALRGPAGNLQVLVNLVVDPMT